MMKNLLIIVAFIFLSNRSSGQISPYINVVNSTGCTILVKMAGPEASGTWSVPLSLYTNFVSLPSGGSWYRYDLAAVTAWSASSAGGYTAYLSWGDWDHVAFNIPSTSTFGGIANGAGTISTGSPCGAGTVTWTAIPAPGAGYTITFN